MITVRVSKNLAVQIPAGFSWEWVYWGNGYREVSIFLKDRGYTRSLSDPQWERDLFVGPETADLHDMPSQG